MPCVEPSGPLRKRKDRSECCAEQGATADPTTPRSHMKSALKELPSPPSSSSPRVIKRYATMVSNYAKAHTECNMKQMALPKMSSEWMDAHGKFLSELCVERRADGYFVVLVDRSESPVRVAARHELRDEAGGSVPAELSKSKRAVALIPKLRSKRALSFSPSVYAQYRGTLLEACDSDASPVTVATGYSEAQYHSHEDRQFVSEFIPDGKGSTTGTIKIYEVRTNRHDGTAGKLQTMLLVQDHTNMELAGGDYKLGDAGPTYNFDGGIDPNGRNTGAAAPKNVINGSEFPTIVIEVAVSEGPTHVHNKAMEWIGPNTTVQECWVIKLFSVAGHMWFSRYVRGAPVNPVAPHDKLEFGTVGYLGRAVVPPCIAAGIPTYLVHIPAANVYHGVAPVPAGPAGGFVLDLYSLQQYILTLPVP